MQRCTSFLFYKTHIYMFVAIEKFKVGVGVEHTITLISLSESVIFLEGIVYIQHINCSYKSILQSLLFPIHIEQDRTSHINHFLILKSINLLYFSRSKLFTSHYSYKPILRSSIFLLYIVHYRYYVPYKSILRAS